MNTILPPLVSVCIPTYNHERYIAQCLHSVLMQVHSVGGSIEILIGDDLSTDRTGDIVKEISASASEFFRYFRHAENKGAVGNLEFLIREARGQYIAHLDGDDFWLPEKLSTQLAFLESNTECPAVYSNAFCIHDDGTPAGIFSNFRYDRVSLAFLVRRGNFLNHSSMLYRSSLKECILPPKGSLLDFSTHLNLAKMGDLGYLVVPLTAYRVSSSSSILLNANDYVRELYWAALCNVSPPLVSAHDLNNGKAEFLRSVFFRSLRMRSFNLLKKWWPCVLGNSSAHYAKVMMLVTFSILRVGSFESVSWICRKFSGNKLRVLYPK